MYYMMLGCWDLEMADRPSCERLQNFLKSFPLEEHENTYQTADVNEPIQHGAPACEPGCELECEFPTGTSASSAHSEHFTH